MRGRHERIGHAPSEGPSQSVTSNVTDWPEFTVAVLGDVQ